jgi:exodeoxyribonuclease VII small subunit
MADKKEITFEAAIAELGAVVEKLEAVKVALAESLALYERGVALTTICNECLDAAE